MKTLAQGFQTRRAPLWREPHDAPTFVACDQAAKVLVVEDDPVQALLLSLMLNHLGMKYHVVSDGAQAIEAVKNTSYALVLMDYLMPGVNGIEATRSIRHWERDTGRAPTPIAAVTASAMVTECRSYIEAGMNDVITKPFSAQSLASLLSRYGPVGSAQGAPLFSHSGVTS